MKFSELVQLRTGNFWAGMSDQLASRLQPWAKNGLFLENLSALVIDMAVGQMPVGLTVCRSKGVQQKDC